MKTGLAMLLLAGLCAAQTKTINENQVRSRGQTPLADPSQSPARGRLGTQAPMPDRDQVYTGILVDGGCRDRTAPNLRREPDAALATIPTQPEEQARHSAQQTTPRQTGSEASRAESSATNAKGISVNQQTAQAERDDALAHQVPDMRSRQDDPTCAINGATKAFGLLMANGRLVDLDEGGNTYAAAAVQGSRAGQAMLNGNAPGVKPQASIKGRVRGDQLIVDSLRLQQ